MEQSAPRIEKPTALRERGDWRRYVPYLPPLATAIGVRAFNLADQIVGDDEMHAIIVALSLSPWEVLTSYFPYDHSVPLTFTLRTALEAGLFLTEWIVRAPALLAGIVAVVAIPSLARSHIGASSSRALAWLIALAPALVLYSRIVRPYAIVVLLGSCAALAFYAALEDPVSRRRNVTLYAVAGSIAVYFHLVAAPFVLAPLAFAAVDVWWPGTRPRMPRSALARAATMLAALTALFYFPLAGPLVEAQRARFGDMTIPLGILEPVARLAAGTAYSAWAVVFWVLAVTGFGLLAARHATRRFAAYALSLILAQVVAVFVVAPNGASNPLIFFRYILIAMPLVLTGAAVAASRWPGLLAAVVTGTVAFGPLVGREFRRGSFVHHNHSMNFQLRPLDVESLDVPPAYRALRSWPPGPVIEFPWRLEWPYSALPRLYQRLHGRRVIVVAPHHLLSDPRVAFLNMLPQGPDSFLRSRARYLIVHRDFVAEQEHVLDGVLTAGDWRSPRAGRMPKAYREHDTYLALATMRRLRCDFGRPVWSDAYVWVFDLAAIGSRERICP